MKLRIRHDEKGQNTMSMQSKDIYLMTTADIYESLVMMRDHAYELSGKLKLMDVIQKQADHTAAEQEIIELNMKHMEESLAVLQTQIAHTIGVYDYAIDSVNWSDLS